MTTKAKQPAKMAGKASKPKRAAKAPASGTKPEGASEIAQKTRGVPFQPGNTFGKGRPKGARNKLGEAFIADLYADWEKHGASVLDAVRESRPDAYMKVIASILPKQVEVREAPLDEIPDDDLALAIAAISAARAAGGSGKRTAH